MGDKEFLFGCLRLDIHRPWLGYASFSDGRLAGGFTRGVETNEATPLIELYATDLEAIKDEVENHGGKITKETFEFPGGRRLHFSDPNGIKLAVWSDR